MFFIHYLDLFHNINCNINTFGGIMLSKYPFLSCMYERRYDTVSCIYITSLVCIRALEYSIEAVAHRLMSLEAFNLTS
jgi:hypothetical protein